MEGDRNLGLTRDELGLPTQLTIDETTRQKMRVHQKLERGKPKVGKNYGNRRFRTTSLDFEYDLTRAIYLPRGNDLGYNLHPTGCIE